MGSQSPGFRPLYPFSIREWLPPRPRFLGVVAYIEAGQGKDPRVAKRKKKPYKGGSGGKGKGVCDVCGKPFQSIQEERVAAGVDAVVSKGTCPEGHTQIILDDE